MGDDRLKILIEAFDSTKAAFADIQKSVIDLKREMRNMTDETVKQTAVVQDLATAFAAIKTRVLEIVAAIYVFKKAWDWAEATAEIHEQESSLDSLGKKYGMTAARITSMLDEASDGLLKYSDALKLATRGTALGFDPNLLADFVYYATRLKEINPGKTIAEISEAIMRASSGARGGSGALLEMGVLSNTREGMKRLSDELERSSSLLSAQERQAASTNVVLKALSDTVEGLGPKVESAHDAMIKLKNVLGDIYRFLGDVSLKVLGGLALLFGGLTEAAYGLVNALAYLIDSYASWLDLASKVPLLGKLITKEDAAAMHGYADSLGRAADSIKGFQGKVYNFAGIMMGVDMPASQKPPYKPSREGVMPGGGLTAEEAKKQTEVLKAALAARIEALKLNSAQENDVNREALSNLQLAEMQNLISIEDFLRNRAAIEQSGIQIEISNLEKERSETATKFDQIIALWTAVGAKRTEIQKFTNEKTRAIDAIDIQLFKKNSDLKISASTEEIRGLQLSLNIEEAARQAIIAKLQQEISVRQQLNNLLVQSNKMTPLEETRQQIADQDELNKKRIEELDILLARESITKDRKVKLQGEKDALQAQIDSQAKLALNEQQLFAAGLKSLDIQKQHVENALKLTEQYAELTGDYQNAYDLQVKILEVEKQRKLLVPGITDAEKAAVLELYNQQIYRATLMKTPAGGFALGATDMANEFQNTSKQMYELARNAASDMSSAFSEGFFDVMKGNFSDLYNVATKFLDAIAKRIFNLAADQATGWIFRGLGKYYPTGDQGSTLATGDPALMMHEGSHGVIRIVPRLHKGLAPDEFPAILQTGERVLSRSEVNAGAPNVMINIENKTGQEVKQSNVGTSFNGKDYVISIVLEAARYNMGFRNALGIGR